MREIYAARQRAAEPPAAELLLVAQPGDHRQLPARVAEQARLHELHAALVLVQRVVQADAQVELVVHAGAAHGFPVGVVGKGVHVHVERSVALRSGGTRAESEGRGEDLQRAAKKGSHGRPLLSRGRESVPYAAQAQPAGSPVRWRTIGRARLCASAHGSAGRPRRSWVRAFGFSLPPT